MKSQTRSTAPRDAAAVILLNSDFSKVLWARRNPQLSFLGGYHAFPGGKVEDGDGEITVADCVEKDSARLIVAAARETFEEVGVLLARGGDKLTKGQIVSIHDDLISGRFSFAEILENWGLYLDAKDFYYTGFWTTPQFSPVRFKTRFFLAICPAKQTPYAAINELVNVVFIQPNEALKHWENSQVLISPPVLIALQELASQNGKAIQLNALSKELLEKSQKFDGNIHHIELNPRVICFPLNTETLPPATHTNCFIVGKKEFVVIDAASPLLEEQDKLFSLIDSFIEKGFVCQSIIVSHLHRDHFGGEIALQKHLSEKFNLQIPISAHELTARSLRGKVKIERFLSDREIFKLRDETGETFDLKVLHAPGHARGHLIFYDEEKGFLLSSDNVVGTGTVVIAPPQGNMRDYLNSLERMKILPNLRFLCGSHGAAVFDAQAKIESYIAHRLEREKQVLRAIESGAKTAGEIVEKVYIDLQPELVPLAEKSVEAHLEKLREDNLLAF